ncbi:TetR/AcrR family transcriptional regulator [Spelaeicoccus albus]|uniref:AcrR family transcriptional regulator n=2 Tax=Spelaeicoccus albus TaxID=1280376 RepID=A0A7Z0D1J3_9MICO|nr:TetR/AcrR family transcriptional regulator [Spelaeicoccus albus]NYI66372.1 AcrR family transcriptional regulator [Spelaeicoccus albus]
MASHEHPARAERILRAAGSLVVSIGYDKTTIADVARRAGVAKGTIYLHWPTREALFTALVHHERIGMIVDCRERLGVDGDELDKVFEQLARALMSRPVVKAFIVNDSSVLGRLAYAPVYSVNRHLWDDLAAAEVIRTDLEPWALTELASAVFFGFFLVTPLTPSGKKISDDDTARLIGDAMNRALRRDLPLTIGGQRKIADVVYDYLERAERDARATYEASSGA